jgi:peptidoglycan-associated lipoprotein
MCGLLKITHTTVRGCSFTREISRMEDEVNHRTKWMFIVLALAAMMVVGACKKKVAPPPPPPPPPPAAPTAQMSVSPETIQKGQSATLTWSTTNTTDVSINGIGTVDANGSKSVTPSDSTTYRLTAKGPGGSADATARVTVTTPPPPPPPPQATSSSEEDLFSQNVKDIYFDYDKYDLRPGDQTTVQANAAFLAQHPNFKFTIEGHCDERGSTEYNLALGDNRANSAKQALVSAGVSADRIKTISYGKEKPVCTESTESCWQQNRRAHFAFGQK